MTENNGRGAVGKRIGRKGGFARILQAERGRGDPLLLILAVLLSAFGVVAIYSASRYVAKTQFGDEWHFVKKQLVGFGLGIVAMLICARMPCRVLQKRKVRRVLYVTALVLLALVFVPGLGKSSYGATRWIAVGGITLQPSEIAKYALVVLVAGYAAEDGGRLRTFSGVLPMLACGGAVCVLILLEPNMSVTVCVVFTLLSLLFLGGMKMQHFLIVFIPAALAIPVLIALEPYRLSRLSAFLDPWENPRGEGYQLIQSLYALGNGGWFGTGLFRSRQKYRFLPFAESDFILAIIGEECGFVGVLILFSACAAFIFCGIRAASKADDLFSYLLAMGITLVYAVQTLVNALVVSGSIPPTGLPLPFISSGNTALIVNMVATGVLYAVSAQGGRRKREGKGKQKGTSGGKNFIQ